MTMPPAPPPPPVVSTVPSTRRPGATLALILGIVAVVCALIPVLSYVAGFVGIAAIIVGIIAARREVAAGRGTAIVGLVLGIVAILLGVILSIVYTVVLFLGAVATSIPSYTATVPAASAPPQASSSSEPSASAAVSDTSSATPSAEAFATKTYSGRGDDVIKVDISDPVVVTFSCAACDGNTTLKTDSGLDTLPVNTIGAYTGSHLLNQNDGSLLTKLTIGADAKWTVKIESLATHVHKIINSTGQTVSGKGDDVIGVSDAIGDAKIVNHAGANAGNFEVTAYGSGVTDPLIVNEIGSYSGTDPLQGPAVVQVVSDGSWTITGQD